MKIFFSVGEPSGDIHGANLIEALRRAGKEIRPDEEIKCVGFGGPKMQQAGAELMFDLTSLAVMWVGRVLWNIRAFFKLADQAEAYFKAEKPDAVVLIDYPGFNWHIAKRAHAAGIPVYYYSPPQLWGWAQWRVKKMRMWVDCILSGLPFETDWYNSKGCKCVYVGHPFFDETAKLSCELRPTLAVDSIAILPGSRTQEVEQNMASFIKAAKIIQAELASGENPREVRFRVAAFKEAHKALIEPIVAQSGLNIEVKVGQTQEIIAASDAVMSVSGSVSLELLYHEAPTVILYKVCRFGMFLQSIFRTVKYITLVNLLRYGAVEMRAPDTPEAPNPHTALFPEFLTSGDESAAIARQIIRWLTDSNAYNQEKAELKRLKEEVCQPGAAEKAARIILAGGIAK